MTVRLCQGDIFESKCQALVNPVNCIGVVGKGLALEFKRRFKEYFKWYKSSCDLGMIMPGFVDVAICTSRPVIISFPTKDRWKDKSTLDDIARGLCNLECVCSKRGIKSIAIPALGCGLGGLEFDDVKQLVLEVFADSEIGVELYEPKG